MISRAPNRATASTGSSCSPTPANTSSSSRRSRSLGTIFAMRTYLQCFVLSGQKRRLRPHYVSPVNGTAPTLAYLAALDVHDPRRGLFGHCEPKISNDAFDALVEEVMTSEPYASAQRVFWVVDNGTSHRGQKAID